MPTTYNVKIKTSLVLGAAAYGAQYPKWWSAMMNSVGQLWRVGIDFRGVLVGTSMMTDGNRNEVVKMFLKTNAEWLLWVDTDNFYPTQAIKRMIEVNKTLVSGVYVGKNDEALPIIFRRLPSGRYVPMDEFLTHYRGEIAPADAAGMGALLSHRSVYEDMLANFEVFQGPMGEHYIVKSSDVSIANRKKIKKIERMEHTMKPRVKNGSLVIPLYQPTDEYTFPWFMIDHGRTEDMTFYENAAKVGHKLWIDTSIEVPHLGPKTFTMEDRRSHRFKVAEKQVVPDGFNHLDFGGIAFADDGSDILPEQADEDGVTPTLQELKDDIAK